MAPTWTTIALALLATRPEPTLPRAPALSRPTDRQPDAPPAAIADPSLAAAAPGASADDEDPDAPLTAPAPRIRVAILRSDGFIEPDALARAIRLRLPAVTLVSDGEPVPAAEEGSLRAFIELRHDESQLLLTLILADGRAYLRQLELDADASPRPVASALANLVAAIEDDTAVPDQQDVPVPAALLATPQTPVPKDIPAPATPRPAPAPRWQLGPLLRASASLGLAPPGLRGAGAGLGLDARAPSGLLLAADLQWLTRAVDHFHLQRLRVGLGLGYALRRGGFELPAAVMLSVETWRLGSGHGKVPLSSPAGKPGPLLGLGLRLSPGYSAPIGRAGARLRVGARVELWSSGQANAHLRRPVLRLPNTTTALGGLELGLGLEVGVWFPVGPGLRPRSKRPGP